MTKETIISERTKLILLILIILVLGGLIFYGFLNLFVHIQNWWWVVGVIFYFLLMAVVSFINKRFKLKVTQNIEKIILCPIIILKYILDIAKPAVYVLMSFFYMIMVSFIVPLSILIGLNLLFNWGFNSATMLFVALALGSILSVYLSKIMQSLICKIPPLNQGEHKFQLLGKDLAMYILHPRNLSFLFFLLYFIYLSVSGFIYLQFNGFLLNKEIDTAILRAFLVFIACTNMVSKSREVDMQAKGLLKRMLFLMFIHDDN
ncbi:MAG: hypothetical protein IKX31_06430 [Muribaculaceae bacterium]|nr:hypothetical protein [Muribaculaceae bacterium]